MKNEYVILLIESNVNLILLFALYYLVRNRIKVNLRRTILLLLPLFSIIPSIVSRIDFVSKTQFNLPLINLDPIILNQALDKNSVSITSTVDYVFWFYLVGFILLLISYAYRYYRTTRLISKATLISGGKISIYEDSELPSFSFFNKIVLNANLDSQSKDIILKHEMVHVEKRHSFDKLWLSIIHTTSWFNPLFLILNKELDNVQEYQVDNCLYEEFESSYTDFILSHVFGVNSFRNHLTHQFGLTSNLKNRIIMMTKTVKRGWVATLLFPVMIFSMSLISLKAVAQETTTKANEPKKGDEPYTFVEKMPQYTGGEAAMGKFINDNIRYPKGNNKEGKVYVTFVVRKNGKITDVSVLRGFDEYFDKESVRVIKIMPNWIPGEQKGKKVDVKFILPINITK